MWERVTGTRGWDPGKHSRSRLGSVEDAGATCCSFRVEVDNFLERVEIRLLLSKSEIYALRRYKAVYIPILRLITRHGKLCDGKLVVHRAISNPWIASFT